MKKYEIMITRKGEVGYAVATDTEDTLPGITDAWMDPAAGDTTEVYCALVNHHTEAEAVLMALEHSGLIRITKFKAHELDKDNP